MISASAEIAQKNVLWRALHLPDMSYLKNVIILRGTNNICNNSTHDIAQCLIDIGVCFRNRSSKFPGTSATQWTGC